MIDFESKESHLLLNPRMPRADRERLERLEPPLEGHVFVATSGSTGAMKLVALSKAAILASAAAVNERLEITSRDRWAAVLPPFHVGGLGIHARAHLSGCHVVAMSWNAAAFAAADVTVASLVPAQVHDLVAGGFAPPHSLRAILVGGGALNPALDERALAAGWPVLASYGMSECCSTVAIRDVLLGHVEARCDEDGRIALRGPSLLTGYATEEGLVDPKRDGWFLTEDLGESQGRLLRVRGREGEFVKVGGESVDLSRLDRILGELIHDAGFDAAVIAQPDRRLGAVIHLVAADGGRGGVEATAGTIVEAFNARVLPFERIRAVRYLRCIPRSPLGKLRRAELLRELNRSADSPSIL